MSASSVAGAAVDSVSPLRDPSRERRLVKIAAWLAGLALLVLVLELLGVDVVGWLEAMWKQIENVPVGYLIAGILLQVAQTTLNGVAYYGILSYGYPDAGLKVWPIVTAYAVGVAMNSFLPANIGTFVTLVMFVAIVPGSTFPGIFAAYLVHKIFFMVVGGVVYLLLFLEAGAAFDVELGWFRDHPGLLLIVVAGGAFLVVLLVRVFWRWLKGVWARAKRGGAILGDPKAYVTRVLVPEMLSYAAKVGVIAILLAAFSIPVTFGSIVRVIGSSSAANMTSVTPGAVGVTQAANSVALRDFTDSSTATAYSLTQQLVTSATNVVYALVLVVLVFGWTGGKLLVQDSYADAKRKVKRRGAALDEEGAGAGAPES
jgi:uncharacterized membrane protein YbhN (UPF0104 family)